MREKVQRSWNSTLRRSTKPIKQRPKTKERNQLWQEICLWLIGQDVVRFGHPMCWWCGGSGSVDSESFFGVWGHHKNGERNDTNWGNCYICHTATCHHFITEHHVDVRIYKTRKEWGANR